MSEARKKIVLRNGRVFDPVQGWRGEVRDIYIADGRISEPFRDPDEVIDTGLRAVMAGGIEPCCHLGTPWASLWRAGAGFSPIDRIGEIYARMGYVHVHQPLMTLLTAGAVRYAMSRIPFVDTSAWVSLDLRDLGTTVRAQRKAEFVESARALLELTGGIGVFLPFPHLKHRQRHYAQKNISAKTLFQFISSLTDADIVPIALWALPGVLDNDRDSLCLFHLSCAGAALGSEGDFERACALLAVGGSVDLGLSTGMPCMAVTAAERCSPGDLSVDMGMGAPIRFGHFDPSFNREMCRNGWRLLCLWEERWHLSLSPAGIGGCEPDAFPQAVSWLLEGHGRPAMVEEGLGGRVFGLYEVASLTRAEPARCLGLADRGHLEIGARADVSVYEVAAGMQTRDLSRAMGNCWCLIKDGVVVRDKGAFTGLKPPRRFRSKMVETRGADPRQSEVALNASLRCEHLKYAAGLDGATEVT
jgi:formylmethanofuran dehydrogenase subunit A